MAVYIDGDTVSSATSLSGAEDTNVEAATITSITTPGSIASSEVYVVSTRDYNNNPWSVTYNFNSLFPVAGSVGVNDTDHGEIT